MLMGFAVVAVVSETLADSGVDVVDGSLVTGDELRSTRTPFVNSKLGQKDRKFSTTPWQRLLPNTATKRCQNSRMFLSSKRRIILVNCVLSSETLVM